MKIVITSVLVYCSLSHNRLTCLRVLVMFCHFLLPQFKQDLIVSLIACSSIFCVIVGCQKVGMFFKQIYFLKRKKLYFFQPRAKKHYQLFGYLFYPQDDFSLPNNQEFVKGNHNYLIIWMFHPLCFSIVWLQASIFLHFNVHL